MITWTAPCPAGHDATWTQTGELSMASIDCRRCDADFTVAAQVTRWQARTVSRPVPLDLTPPRLRALRGSPLYRLFRAVVGRAL